MLILIFKLKIKPDMTNQYQPAKINKNQLAQINQNQST